MKILNIEMKIGMDYQEAKALHSLLGKLSNNQLSELGKLNPTEQNDIAGIYDHLDTFFQENSNPIPTKRKVRKIKRSQNE